jgi:hypothetical protein
MDRRAHPGGIRRLLADTRERRDRGRGGSCSDRGVCGDGDRRVLLRHQSDGGYRPKPSSPEGKRIERAVTLATVIQLVASFALPVIVIGAGHSDWVLPSIALTIGPLLLWLDRAVHVPRYRPVGWALIVGPLILVAAMSGTPLVATTGIAAGILLLGTAVAGFHDLAGVRRRTEQAKASDLALAASTGAQL